MRRSPFLKFIIWASICVGIYYFTREALQWERYFYSDYGSLANYSDSAGERFRKKLLSHAEKENLIFIHNLADFKWDVVCVVSGYTRLREDLAQGNFYGKDIPELERFPQVKESHYNFVFLNNGQLVAVIDYPPQMPKIRYTFGICSGSKSSRLKLIEPGAFLETLGATKNGLKSNIQSEYFESLKGCIGTNCETLYYAE